MLVPAPVRRPTGGLVPVFSLYGLNWNVFEFALNTVYQQGCLGIGRGMWRDKRVRDKDERWVVDMHLM